MVAMIAAALVCSDAGSGAEPAFLAAASWPAVLTT
jgi:hypothetical protein